MANFFISCDYVYGQQLKYIYGEGGAYFSTTPPFFDLISVSIAHEDGNQIDILSNEFNLDSAWEEYKEIENDKYPFGPKSHKFFFVQEKILRPLFFEYQALPITTFDAFNRKTMRELMKFKGVCISEMRSKIEDFVYGHLEKGDKATFYGLNGAHDWVAFCSIFDGVYNTPSYFSKEYEELNSILHFEGITLTPPESLVITSSNRAKRNLKIYHHIKQIQNEQRQS
jgi:hypothetical protein